MLYYNKLVLALMWLCPFCYCFAQSTSPQDPIDFNITMKNEWCTKAFDCLQEEKYEVAHAYFTIAIELDSSFVLPYFGRIQAKIGEENLFDAWNDYERLIDLDLRFTATDLAKDYTDSTFHGVLTSYGYHFLEDSYQETQTLKEDEYFEDLLASITNESLQLPAVLTPYDQGMYHFNNDKWDKALQSFDEELSINPTSKEAYLQRGITKTRLKDFEGAFDDYNDALNLPSPHWEVYYFRGMTHVAINNALLALIDFNKSLIINPNNTKAYLERAKVYGLLGDYEVALKDYEHILELSPNFLDVYIHRGILYMENDYPEEACNDWKKALEEKDKQAIKLWTEYCE